MFDFKKYREIEKIIHKSGKKTEIIAISKNHSLQQVEQAISHKVEIFGENRVQEALKKFENIKTITNQLNSI